MEPVDVAAHLKIVGESLSIIGMKLQEHRVSDHYTNFQAIDVSQTPGNPTSCHRKHDCLPLHFLFYFTDVVL